MPRRVQEKDRDEDRSWFNGGRRYQAKPRGYPEHEELKRRLTVRMFTTLVERNSLGRFTALQRRGQRRYQRCATEGDVLTQVIQVRNEGHVRCKHISGDIEANRSVEATRWSVARYT
jgi:hypothetical protein